jgi:putative holliday junction resolvase
MNLLGIDYGDKRVGVAITTDNWVKPLTTLINTSDQEVIDKIQELVSLNAINKVIFGMPQPLKTQANERSRITQEFGEKLKKNLAVPLIFTSEIFTSKLAKRSAYTKKQKQQVDARAACFILENYLKKNES